MRRGWRRTCRRRSGSACWPGAEGEPGPAPLPAPPGLLRCCALRARSVHGAGDISRAWLRRCCVPLISELFAVAWTHSVLTSPCHLGALHTCRRGGYDDEEAAARLAAAKAGAPLVGKRRRIEEEEEEEEVSEEEEGDEEMKVSTGAGPGMRSRFHDQG